MDFRHLGDRLVHRGHVWDVVVGSFRGPDGELFERDIVRSPGAVAAVPVREVGGVAHVVLVRQYRAAFGERLIEVPAGMRDVDGEDVQTTIERELVEEVGFRAGSLRPLTQIFSAVGMTDSTVHIYLATDLVQVERSLHGPEERSSEVVQIPLPEAVGMVLDGRIRDSKSVVGLLLAERVIGRES